MKKTTVIIMTLGLSGAIAQYSFAEKSERTGEQVFSEKCHTCHATGAAGAPKLGDVKAWEARLAKGTDALYTSSTKGFKGMPAKGLCFDCSDQELKNAVDYMIGKLDKE